MTARDRSLGRHGSAASAKDRSTIRRAEEAGSPRGRGSRTLAEVASAAVIAAAAILLTTSLLIAPDPVRAAQSPGPPGQPGAAPAGPSPAASAEASPAEFIVQGGRIYPVSSDMIEDGAVWVKDGKIYQVGRIQQVAGGDRIMTCVDGCALQVRADMPMVDARGKWIFPGMIDAHTALGLVEIAKEPTVNDEDEGAVDPLTPQLRASDAIWPETAAIPVTRVEGITSVLVVPANHRFTYFGGGNVVAGQSALIDLAGNTVDEMLVKSPVGMHVNLGEWPKDRYRPKNKLPTTRMGTAALLRQALIDAKAYREKWERYVKEGGEAPEAGGVGTGGAAASGAQAKAASPEDRAGAEPSGTEIMERPGPDRSSASRQGRTATGERPSDKPAKPSGKESGKSGKSGGKTPDRPERDLRKEALLPVLRRELPIVVRAHRADDILTAIRIADEFELRMILDQGTEAYKVAGELVKRGIPVLVGPITTQPERMETLGAIYENAARLQEAGVKIAIQTDEVHHVRHLPFEAGLAVAYGLPWDEAIRAITLSPAEIFGVEDRVGSFTNGTEANLFIADGDPLELTTRIEKVYIRGVPVPMTNRQLEQYRRYSK